MSSTPLSLTPRQIAKEKFLAEHPDARVATGLPRLDVATFAGQLLKQQRAFRLGAAKARKDRATDRRRHRIRVRTELITPDTKPLDTGTDKARGRLYFELPNGQIVNSARILRVRGHKKEDRRPANPVLRTVVLNAVEANAARKAA